MKAIRQFFTPPAFPDDEDKTRDARILYAVLSNMLFMVALDALAVIFVAVKKVGASITLFFAFILVLISRELASRGSIQPASRFLVITFWILFSIDLLLTGRITTTIFSFQLALTVVTSILLGKRFAIVLAVLSCFIGLIVFSNISYPFRYYFPSPPLSEWVNLVLAFAWVLTSLSIAIQTSADALARARKSEKQIRKTLSEKETLLHELYHRTKNNMGVIIALLEIQSNYFKEEQLKMAFKNTGNRIRSMALVHQKLYDTNNLSYINMKDYISDLIQLLMKSYRTIPEKISFAIEIDDLMVLVDTAIPCGLILNELISNSLKYAFPDGRKGQIMIKLRRTEGEYILLCVSDDGVGMPTGFNIKQDGLLGLHTILLLGESQLKAKVDFLTENGVTCQLLFKDNLYEPRV